MQPDTLHAPLSAVGTEVVLPSAASFGGFVQVRTAPRIGSGCGLDGASDAAFEVEASSHTTLEVPHAR